MVAFPFCRLTRPASPGNLFRAGRPGKKLAKVVFIGHSFGALVMKRSTAEGLPGALMFQGTKSGVRDDQAVVMPADLIIMLNSGRGIHPRKGND